MTVDKWERRQLCEDGACVGVIGQEGTCKTCGKPASDFGDLRKPGRVSSKSDVDEEPVLDEVETEPATTSPAKVAAAKGTKVAAWNERLLCSDGTCIGLIGDDGKCKVCRTPADGSAAKAGEDEDEDDDEVVNAADDGEDDEDDEDDEDEDDEEEVAQGAIDDDDDDDDDEDEDEEDGDDYENEASDEKADDEADRKLCTDGACIGVIGADGKCKTCGKAAA